MPFRFTGNTTEGIENLPRSPLSFHFGAIPDGGEWLMICKKCDRMWKLPMKEHYTTEELSHFIRHVEMKCKDIPSIYDYMDGGE
jgi:hypothetical protein